MSSNQKIHCFSCNQFVSKVSCLKKKERMMCVWKVEVTESLRVGDFSMNLTVVCHGTTIYTVGGLLLSVYNLCKLLPPLATTNLDSYILLHDSISLIQVQFYCT